MLVSRLIDKPVAQSSGGKADPCLRSNSARPANQGVKLRLESNFVILSARSIARTGLFAPIPQLRLLFPD
jgi:hypothetical protein